MSKPSKILAFGDVRGKFELFVKRINAFERKAGPFEVVFAVGEFFGTDDAANEALLTGKLPKPAVPVYVMGPMSRATCKYFPEDSAELCENITYLGRVGQLTLACGLSVAFVSGMYDRDHSANEHTFNEESIEQLLVMATATSQFNGVDVLLTSEWPRDVQRYVGQPPPSAVDGVAVVSQVAAALRPRYHIAGGHNVFYERQPYRNHRVLIEAAVQCTRFVGLGQVGNAEKGNNYVYAFNIVPMKHLSKAELTQQPPDAGEFPYAQAVAHCFRQAEQRRREKESGGKPGSGGGYFFDMDADMHSYENGGDGRPRRGRGGKRPMVGDREGAGGKRPMQGPCWFCLSSPDVAKHMIVSIGDCCYVALPKGPLHAAHMLIVPVGHVPNLVVADAAVRQESRRFREALRKCIRDQFDMDMVCYERNYRTQHMLLNCVPVPRGANVRQAFVDAAKEQNEAEVHCAQSDEDVWDVIEPGAPYFSVYLQDDTLLYIRNMRGFQLQFGRQVLCRKDMLDCEEKADWKEVKLTKDEETDMATAFKDKFARWDFSLEDDD